MEAHSGDWGVPAPPAATSWSRSPTYGACFDFQMAFKASREEKELPLGAAACLRGDRTGWVKGSGSRDLGPLPWESLSQEAWGSHRQEHLCTCMGQAPLHTLEHTTGSHAHPNPHPIAHSPAGPEAPCCWGVPGGRRSARFSAGSAHRPWRFLQRQSQGLGQGRK